MGGGQPTVTPTATPSATPTAYGTPSPDFVGAFQNTAFDHGAPEDFSPEEQKARMAKFGDLQDKWNKYNDLWDKTQEHGTQFMQDAKALGIPQEFFDYRGSSNTANPMSYLMPRTNGPNAVDALIRMLGGSAGGYT